ncbi:MAG: archaetidylserine decarboxylase [Oligoflexus sp.]
MADLTSNLTLGKIIPLNFVSQVTGRLARWEAPGPVNRLVCRSFVKLFGIDMSESAQELDTFRSVEDVFTRALKPDARKIEGPLCSPADGTLSCSGTAKKGDAVQAKGLYYNLSELVFGTKNHDELAYYATVYLAPHNYHRVHSPLAGKLLRMRYFPGELWPVNRPFVRFAPRLFIRNERLVFDFEDSKSRGRIHLVMVGALNVGRIISPFWEGFFTNGARRQRKVQEKAWVDPLPVKLGQEIGTFMLGSTVVIAFDKKAADYYKLKGTTNPTPVLMGQKLT